MPIGPRHARSSPKRRAPRGNLIIVAWACGACGCTNAVRLGDRSPCQFCGAARPRLIHGNERTRWDARDVDE